MTKFSMAHLILNCDQNFVEFNFANCAWFPPGSRGGLIDTYINSVLPASCILNCRIFSSFISELKNFPRQMV